MVIRNTSSENQTEGFDPYCIQLLEGPLVWGVFSIPCACVGVPASMWLLWVLVQKRRRGLSNDVYMLNLTVMDFVFNLSILPCTINFFFLRNDPFFMIIQVLYCFSISGRPLFMACICVDCYTAVVHPISYMKMKQSKHRMVAIALAWSLTLVYGMVFVLDIQLYTTAFTVIPYILSLPTITFCDFSILCALRKPSPSGRSDVHPQKQKALQTIINSFTMAIVAYLPPLVVFSFSPLFPLSAAEIWCNVQSPALIAPLIGSSIMPVLYLHNLGCLKGLGRCGCA